jgi:hypothetical protein
MGASEDIQSVSGLVPGIESTASVVGDIDEARKIARHSLDVVKQFSEAVIRGDVEQAYALCANELRNSMSVKRFVTELQKQDDEWGGKPIDYSPQRIVWIYASEQARKRSNKDHAWPKDTPKPSKRAMLNGWWATERPEGGQEFGRPLTFWVSEEEDGYRIAKFRPYRP